MQSNILDYISGENHKENGLIRIEYSPYALHQSNKIFNNGIQDQAIRRKYEEGITIDGIGTLDMDDGIWAEKTKNGYSIFVHISDVTEAIPQYSPLDIEALKRTTSIYRQSGVISMIPEKISHGTLSLTQDSHKLTLTARIDLSFDGEIVDFEVYESIFKNTHRHSHESFIQDFLDPDSQNHQTFQLMYEIARIRKQLRISSGAITDFNESDRSLFIEKNKEKNIFHQKIPSTIIEEFMILANIATATIFVKNNYNAIFRVHHSVHERSFYQNLPSKHMGLALENYTHFTSPIRRYADMIVHRILKLVHLRGEENPYKKGEISDIAQYINLSRTIIEILGEQADEEIKGQQLVSKIKEKNGNSIHISNLTLNIRNIVSNGKKIPQSIVNEIILDIKNGDKGNWAWAVGVFLVSQNQDIKEVLKDVLLNEKKFSSKSLLSILSNTKVSRNDDYLFQFEEQETSNGFHISVFYKGEKLFSYQKNFPKYIGRIIRTIPHEDLTENQKQEIFTQRYLIINHVRKKIIEKTIFHFCGK